jgi:hypothetical protein
MVEKMVTLYAAIVLKDGKLPHIPPFRITDLLAKILSSVLQNMNCYTVTFGFTSTHSVAIVKYVCKGWAIKPAPAPQPSTIYCAKQ